MEEHLATQGGFPELSLKYTYARKLKMIIFKALTSNT